MPLQAALATIQKQQGQAAAVDGYRNMYQSLVQERGGLVDRAVELEHRNRLLVEKLERMHALHTQEERQRSGGNPSKVIAHQIPSALHPIPQTPFLPVHIVR